MFNYFFYCHFCCSSRRVIVRNLGRKSERGNKKEKNCPTNKNANYFFHIYNPTLPSPCSGEGKSENFNSSLSSPFPFARGRAGDEVVLFCNFFKIMGPTETKIKNSPETKTNESRQTIGTPN